MGDSYLSHKSYLGTAYRLGTTERWWREWGQWVYPNPEPILTLAEPLSLAKPVCSQHERCKGCGYEKYDRRLVELFCSENSALGRRTKESFGCDVVRVHERMDMNNPVSRENAINALSTPNACAWISAPCTGGARYNTHVNWHRHPSSRAGIEEKQRELYSCFANRVLNSQGS